MRFRIEEDFTEEVVDIEGEQEVLSQGS